MLTMAYSSLLAIVGLVTAPAWSFLDIPLISPGGSRNTSSNYEARAKQILSRVPLVDGHNDLAWHTMLAFKGQLNRFTLRNDSRKVFPYDPNNLSQTDIPRIKKGMLGAQVWSTYTPCKYQYKDSIRWGLAAIDLIKRIINKYNDVFEYVDSADGIMPAFRRGKVASLIGMEGGYMIDSSMAVLRMVYDLGVRYMTLTWSCDTPWADSYLDTRYNRTNHNGLSAFGKRIVREMNRLGMMVDVSHTAVTTMLDSMSVSRAPVIFSHSSAFAICAHHRNVPDNVALKLKENGGIIMINLYPNFINCTAANAHASGTRTASIGQIADHYDHFRNLIGSDYLGIGADFDGADNAADIADVSMYPKLFAELLRRGWTDREIENVAYRNFYRVLKRVEQVRDSMTSVPPDDTLIDTTDIPDLKCRTQPRVWSHNDMEF